LKVNEHLKNLPVTDKKERNEKKENQRQIFVSKTWTEILRNGMVFCSGTKNSGESMYETK